jgi:hypothetical protein
MKFQAAFSYLKRGHAITLPEWGGYWAWDEAGKTILMHLRSGDVMDIRESPDMDYTLSFTFRDDWKLEAAPEATEHGKAAE